jgi:spermidine/putrescine transport system ATP-binding protein
MIFQHLALFPHLTVAENIAFGLEMKKMQRNTILEKVQTALELVRLSGFGSRRVDTLSGGQKQRVAIARALVNEPDVLLLDEPLAALDLRLRLQMQDELRRLHMAIRKTFIFVTHDQGEAMTMSDRIAVMSSGQVAQIGTPREVYEQPAKKFVAQFLGSSNLMVGNITALGSDGIATITVRGVPVPCRVPEGFAIGCEVSILVRYEKVELLPITASAKSGDFEGKLVAEIFMGSMIRYEIAVEGGLVLTSDTPSSRATVNFEAGMPVRVRWPASSAVVLAE